MPGHGDGGKNLRSLHARSVIALLIGFLSTSCSVPFKNQVTQGLDSPMLLPLLPFSRYWENPAPSIICLGIGTWDPKTRALHTIQDPKQSLVDGLTRQRSSGVPKWMRYSECQHNGPGESGSDTGVVVISGMLTGGSARQLMVELRQAGYSRSLLTCDVGAGEEGYELERCRVSERAKAS